MRSIKKLYILKLTAIFVSVFLSFSDAVYAGQVTKSTAASIVSASSGPLGCNDNAGAWQNPTFAVSQDGSSAAITDPKLDSGNNTQQLNFTDFSFSIPNGESILGVMVETDVWSSGGADDHRMHLIIGGAVETTENKASATAWPTGDGSAYRAYGDSTDDWTIPAQLTETNIESSGFGFSLCANSTASNNNVQVDHGRITVYYSDPPPIEISGTLYDDEGITPDTSGSYTIMLAVGSTSPPTVYSTSTIAATGFWGFNFAQNSISEGTPMVAWLSGQDPKAVTVHKASSTNTDLLGFDLYKDRLIINHASTTATSTTIADMAIYDSSNDSDIIYTVNGGDLDVHASTTLYIAPGAEFAPGGDVRIHGNASSADVDGTLKFGAGTGYDNTATTSIITMGTNNLTLSGSWYASSTAIDPIFTSSASTTFVATTTGKNIIATSTPFYNLDFRVPTASGSWSFGSYPATITNHFLSTTTGATITAPSDNLNIGGNYSNSGTFTHNSGTVTLNGTSAQDLFGNMVGDNNAFNNLTITNSSATTTFNAAASTTATFTASTADTRLEFHAGATSTFQDFTISGSAGNEVYIYSNNPGTRWNIHVPGTNSVSFAKIKDSDACSNAGGLEASNSINGGNNVCWSFPNPIFNQRNYVWMNDDGPNVNGLNPVLSEPATNTALTNVKIGQRLVPRIQIDKSGTVGSTTANFRLQFQNQTDSGGDDGWTDVGTTTQIRQAEVLSGANRDGISLNTNVVADCNGGETYWNGRIYAFNATTTAMDIGDDKCTEFAFGIDTANALAGKTYRFRLINGETATTTVTTQYQVYPTFTTQSSADIKFSRGAYGGTTTRAVFGAGFDGGDYTSLEIGVDGNPIISTRDTGLLNDIYFVSCLDPFCTSTSSAAVFGAGVGASRNRLTLAHDGNPLISATQFTDNDIYVVRCLDAQCTSTTSSPVAGENGDAAGYDSDIAIGSDGNPVVLYAFDDPGGGTPDELFFVRCLNPECTSTSTAAQIDSATLQTLGRASMEIDADGNPIIGEVTASEPTIYQCTSSDCSTVNTIGMYPAAVTVWPDFTALLIEPDGHPLIAFFEDDNNELFVSFCLDTNCTATSSTRLIGDNKGGHSISPQTAPDGKLIISHFGPGDSTLYLTRCLDEFCTATTTTFIYDAVSLGISNDSSSLSISSDGYPIIAWKYDDTTVQDIYFTKCLSLDCTTSYPPTDNSDLEHYFDQTEYDNATTSNDVYVEQSGVNATLAHQFVTATSSNTDSITPSWEGQASESQDITLQIYRFGSTNAWQDVVASTSPTINLDTYLSGLINTDVSDYYDASNNVYTRVVMATTTNYSTLRTDSASTTFGLIAPSLNQRAYIFKNDDGTATTSTNQMATSTPRTEVLQGERMNVYFQVDNSGNTTSTAQYILQYDKNDNIWRNAGTSTEDAEIRPSGSLNLVTGIPTSTTTPAVDSICSTSGNYTPGFFTSHFATTSAISLGANDCMDLGFAIHTASSTLNQLYRLRLVASTSGAVTALDSYVQTPSFTITDQDLATEKIKFSKQAFGTSTALTLDSAGTTGQYTSMAIGTDGFPVIAYYNVTDISFEFAKCNDAVCSSVATTTIDNIGDIANGRYSDIAIGSDGLPVMSYVEEDTSPFWYLMFAKCNDLSCSAPTTRQLDSKTVFPGITYNSIAIGADGYPVISYYANEGVGDNGLMLAKCNDLSCFSPTLSTADAGALDTGQYNSIVIGGDGFPVISYYNVSKTSLDFAKCEDASCSTVATSTLDNAAGTVGNYSDVAIGIDGYPVITYAYVSAGLDGYIQFIKCYDDSCSSFLPPVTIETVSATDMDHSSIDIGADGYPVLSYHDDLTKGLKFAKCNDTSCSSVIKRTLDISSTDVGDWTSIAIGTDGHPVISYYDVTNTNLKFIKCNSIDCGNADVDVSANIPNGSGSWGDLDFYLDKIGYQNATSSDDIYDTLSAASSSIVYNFIHENDNSTDEITPEWEGRVSESQDVHLEIYRFGSVNDWVNVVSSTTPTVNLDMYLGTTTIDTSVSDYYDASSKVYIRIVMGTTTNYSTLSTDSASTTFSVIAFNPTISSASNQVFELNQTPTQIASQITITDNATTPQIKASPTDLRIAIATSTVDMRWDTSVGSVIMSGTAWSDDVTSNSVTYEGGNGGDSVMKITVLNDFEAGDQLIINGAKFTSFNAVNGPAGALQIFDDGASDFSADATHSQTVAIYGKEALADSTAGQEGNKFSSPNLTAAELFSFRLTPTGESVTVNELNISISVTGLDVSDFGSIELIPDEDSSGNVDGAEAASPVGGSGVITIGGGGGGYITFPSAFTNSAGKDYILRSNVSNINPGNELRLLLISQDMNTSGVTSAQTIVPTGTAGFAFHARTSAGGTIGGGAPPSQTPIGGTEPGGDEGGAPPDDDGSPGGTEGGGDPGGGGRSAIPKYLASVIFGFQELILLIKQFL